MLTTLDVEEHFVALCDNAVPPFDPWAQLERFIRTFADPMELGWCLNHIAAIQQSVKPWGEPGDEKTR